MLLVQRSLCELGVHLQLKEGVGAESVEVRNQTRGKGVYTLSRSQNRTGNNSNNNPLPPTPTLGTHRQGLYASALDACLVVNSANNKQVQHEHCHLASSTFKDGPLLPAIPASMAHRAPCMAMSSRQ
jgi:hypothetical protein